MEVWKVMRHPVLAEGPLATRQSFMMGTVTDELSETKGHLAISPQNLGGYIEERLTRPVRDVLPRGGGRRDHFLPELITMVNKKRIP